MISKNEKRTDPRRAFRARAAHRRRKIPQVIEPCAPRGVPSEERHRLLVCGGRRDGRAVGDDAVAAAAGGVLRVPRQEGRERRGTMSNYNFLVKKEIVSGPRIEGCLFRYTLSLCDTRSDRDQESLSLDDLKEISDFLKAYIEKEEKQEGGER